LSSGLRNHFERRAYGIRLLVYVPGRRLFRAGWGQRGFRGASRSSPAYFFNEEGWTRRAGARRTSSARPTPGSFSAASSVSYLDSRRPEARAGLSGNPSPGRRRRLGLCARTASRVSFKRPVAGRVVSPLRFTDSLWRPHARRPLRNRSAPASQVLASWSGMTSGPGSLERHNATNNRVGRFAGQQSALKAARLTLLAQAPREQEEPPDRFGPALSCRRRGLGP
jgi:hypothetical protein